MIVACFVKARSVLLSHEPDEDPRIAAMQRARVDLGVFDPLPAAFQEKPLLGVHQQRLPRGDPEERCIEVSRVVEKPALSDVAGAGVGRVWVVDPVKVPSAINRKLPDRIATR